MTTCTDDPTITLDSRQEPLARLRLPGGAYWGGHWRHDKLSVEVLDPEDGSLVAYVHDSSDEDVRDAVTAVVAAQGEHWALWQRREALERASVIMRQEAKRLAEIISAESSKTITEATREVERAAETIRLSAAASSVLEGGTLPLEDTARGEGRLGWTRRAPIGVIAAITPFNDPLNLVAHKLGPALIAGNGVVLKPAKATPLSGLALIEVLLRAGVPAGRVAAVVGGGAALVADPRVGLISFTGGPATGDRIARAAGARKILMELGGNNAVIVCDDGDAVRAAAAIVDGAFGVAGQNCLSVQRVYVHESHYRTVVDEVVRRTGELVVGSKSDAATDVGPMISEGEAKRVESWVADAVACGAYAAIGGTRRGSFLEPTVLLDVPSDAAVLREEVFGPVVSIILFIELDEALSEADSTDYGLQAGVFTADISTAMYAAERLRVGSVLINDTSDFRIDAMPFGGFRRSGIGREGIESAVLEMSAPKNIIVNLL